MAEQKWREDYKPELVCKDKRSIANELQLGKAFWHGHDKEGRPCLIVIPAKHTPGKFTVDETLRFIVYLMEKGLKRYTTSPPSLSNSIYSCTVASNNNNNPTPEEHVS